MELQALLLELKMDEQSNCAYQTLNRVRNMVHHYRILLFKSSTYSSWILREEQLIEHVRLIDSLQATFCLCLLFYL